MRNIVVSYESVEREFGPVKTVEPEDFVEIEELTNQENRIFWLVVKGKSSKAIGNELCISKHTVDTHRRNIIEKLDFNCFFDWLVKAARVNSNGINF